MTDDTPSKPKNRPSKTLKDGEIVTRRRVQRRSVLKAIGAGLAGAAGLTAGGRQAHAVTDSDAGKVGRPSGPGPRIGHHRQLTPANTRIPPAKAEAAFPRASRIAIPANTRIRRVADVAVASPTMIPAITPIPPARGRGGGGGGVTDSDTGQYQDPPGRGRGSGLTDNDTGNYADPAGQGRGWRR